VKIMRQFSKKITIGIIAGLVIQANSALANETTIAKNDASFNTGRLLLTSGEKRPFNTASLGMKNISYSFANSSNQNVVLDNVIGVEEESGSYIAEFGIGLGLAGFLGASLGVAQGEADANAQGVEIEESDKNSIVFSLTAISALIGIVWGYNTKKYTMVYENPQWKSSRSTYDFDLIHDKDGQKFMVSYQF